MKNKVVNELVRRLEDGDGWTRIKMNKDGQHIDIAKSIDGQYLLSYPPYEVNHAFHLTCNTLEEVAEYILSY